MGSQNRLVVIESSNVNSSDEEDVYLKDIFKDDTMVINDDEFDGFVDNFSQDEESFIDELGLAEEWDELMNDGGIIIF